MRLPRKPKADPRAQSRQPHSREPEEASNARRANRCSTVSAATSAIDTQSSDTSATYPSTEKQKDLLRILVDDLKAAGLADAEMDECGYVMATLPSNIPPGAPGVRPRCPIIGLLAHVDTYHEVSRHRREAAGPPGLRRRRHRAARRPVGGASAPAEEPALAACTGMTIITADGTTLLGADDKAGVAEILEALWRFHDDPARLHGADPRRLHARTRRSAAAPSTST